MASFEIDVAEKGSLVVNTTGDNSTAFDNLTSLREAIAFAQTDGVNTPVTFDATVFAAPQIITLSLAKGPITSTGDFDVNAPAVGVTLSGGGQTSLFVTNGGTVHLRNLTLTQGRAPASSGGGVLRASGGTTSVSLIGCTLRESGLSTGATCQGGAVRNSGATVTLTNCTLAGNFATGASSGGGALFQESGTLTVLNCTITQNDVAVGTGGGLWVTGGTVSLGNSIVSGNTAGGGTSPDLSGSIASLGYNLIGDATGATITGTTTGNQTGANPGLDPGGLAYNGGPTPTIRLHAGSPAIDAGKALGGVTTDQRGKTRPFDNAAIINATGGDGSDIGAYEAPTPGPEITVRLQGGADLRSGFNAVDFGAREAGTTTPATFLVSNVGETTLTLTGSGAAKAVLSGGNAADFAVAQQPLSPLAPDQSVSFVVTFHPLSAGTKNTTLKIASDDADENPFSVTLTGSAADTMTVPPVINRPLGGGKISPQAKITFTLPETALAGSLGLTFDNGTAYPFPLSTPAAGSHTVTIDTAAAGMTPGTYSLTLSYRDALSHPPASTTVTNLQLGSADPVSSSVLAQGAAAPGAGTNGLPGDAVIASFGPPATDDAGDLAYVAKWSSDGGKLRGTGLFLNHSCLAVLGGDASAVIGTATAKWRSFTDPIVDAGHLVSIASLTGVARDATTAVVCNLTGSALEKIAQAGSAATADGAKFKTFKGVSISGDKLAVFTQLTIGTGTAPKTSAANDLGVWFQEPNHGVLALREGAAVGGTTIKTLTAFLTGAGSPGQGRGWIIRPTTGGNPQIAALALLSNGARAVVVQDVGSNLPTALSLSGDVGEGSPSISGAVFATYGVPARNSTELTAFVGTLKLNPVVAVTRANAQGIFTNTGFSGKYTPLVRAGQFALGGAVFSLLKDPVVSSDGAIAFPATVAGVSAKGLHAQTLWWQPAGGALTLLAQGGARPGNDLPAEAQWKSFTSLAIAGGDRGPIFAATLVPGKGGVLASSASGVWATDYQNQVRLLFRTGDMIAGKKLKSFVLLKATAGSAAVTRSFNDNAEVVWLATFIDKTQAIVRTQVP